MKIIITDQAFESLEETCDFYINRQGMPSSKVSEIRKELFRQSRTLLEHPYKGKIEEDLSSQKKDHRRILCGNFKIIYRVNEEVIYVTDYFDVRRDPNQMHP